MLENKLCLKLLLESCNGLSSSGGGWQLILRGSGRVKVLEIDFLPRCKGTTRNNMELSAHVSHLLSFRSEAPE